MRQVTSRIAPDATEQLRVVRRKYEDLWTKHRALVRQSWHSALERSGVATLGLFAIKVSDTAYAIADAENVQFRSGRWHQLERDRTAWRATARDTVAPAGAPTLVHLVTAAAEALLRRRAPSFAVARYERPDRGDVFDVRFERIGGEKRICVAIRDVTRLVLAERELAVAKRMLEELGRGGPHPNTSRADDGHEHVGGAVPREG